MAKDTSLTVSLFGRDITLSNALGNAGKSAQTAGDHIEAAGKKAAVVFAAASGAAVLFAKSAAEDEKSSAMLANQLKNVTGASEDQIKATEKWISKTTIASGIADDKLRPALSRLTASTKNIGEAQKLTNLAMEIATAKHLDLETVANALAKANDGNVNGLKKLGISLGDNADNLAAYNKEQKAIAKYTSDAQIALENFGKGSKEYQSAMAKVNQHTETANRLAAAGIDVFGELGDQFKGALSADAETAAGKMERIQNAMNEAKESIGYAFLPALTALAGAFKGIAPFITEHADLIGKIMMVVIGLSGAVVALNAGYKAYIAITKAAAVAQGLLNAVLAMNPITLVVLAVAALAAGLIYAYKHSETFRNVVNGAFNAVKEVAGSVANFIGGVFKTMFGGVKLYINTIISMANMAIGALNKIHINVPDWVPLIGGKEFGFNLPKIPMLAEGGIVNRPTLAMIGEAGPEAVIPLSRGGGFGGSVNIYVAGSVITERDLAIKVRDELGQLLRRKGAPLSALGL